MNMTTCIRYWVKFRSRHVFSELQKYENTSYPVNLLIIWRLYCIRFLLAACSFI